MYHTSCMICKCIITQYAEYEYNKNTVIISYNLHV